MTDRILIVEDDLTFRSIIEYNLRCEGYHVDAVANGNAALEYVRVSRPNLIVLDLTLPDWDGLDLCPLLRKGGSVPIIILSARAQKMDKIKGLSLGADDYITKPTDLEELLARIRAVLRRSHHSEDQLILGRLVINFQTRRATSGRTTVKLTHNEVKLLRYLAERRDQVVHREELLAEVWGYLNAGVTTRSVDQAIFRLRQKIEKDVHHPVYIQTAHRDGYRLTIPGEPPRADLRKDSPR
jgi:DNA-binding response OmpR family regulator